ncbi:MAG: homocysteine S-methyltransferase family protein [Flavobacteriales bacterium]|nr:homocysteine S-methyltransferase family protein [Flavobacteriales bacterium]
MTLKELATKKILILDGAMGTMIQRYRLEENDYRGVRFADHSHLVKGNNDLLCLTRPDIITNIHLQYLQAGADIVETNTFNAQRISMADYHMEDLSYEINLEAAKCAKEAIRQFNESEKANDRSLRPVFVAGAIGPTNRTASLSPDVNDPGFRAVTFDELASAYKEQIKGLLDGGVDIILIETIFDTLNAKAAIYAVMETYEERNYTAETAPPLMVSGTITDASGRTLSGQTPLAFYISMSHAPLFSIGFNCALGAEQLMAHVEVLSDHASCLVSAYPNAGLPNQMGHYDQTPEEMSQLVREYLERGIVNIIGGCCGTTPDHIKALAEITPLYSPRVIEEKRSSRITI